MTAIPTVYKIERILLDEIEGMGHPNVLGTHPTTLEITTEDFLTPRGNCIIAVNGSKSVKDLSPALKSAIAEEKKLEVTLSAGPYSDSFFGYGHQDLDLSNPVSIVFRKSNFISDRTGLINCSKASDELNRDMMHYLQDPTHRLIAKFYLAEK